MMRTTPSVGGVRFGTRIIVTLPNKLVQDDGFDAIISGPEWKDVPRKQYTDEEKLQEVNKELAEILRNKLTNTREDTFNPRFHVAEASGEPEFRADGRWIHKEEGKHYFFTSTTQDNDYQQIDEYNRLREALAEIGRNIETWRGRGVKISMADANQQFQALWRNVFSENPYRHPYPRVLTLNFRGPEKT